MHPCVNAIAYVSIRRLNSTGAVSRWSNLVSGAETLGDKLDLLSSLVIAALAYPRLTLPLTSISFSPLALPSPLRPRELLGVCVSDAHRRQQRAQ